MYRALIWILFYATLTSCFQSKQLRNNPTNPEKSNATQVNRMLPVDEPWVYYGSFPYMDHDKAIVISQVQGVKHDNTLLNSLCAWKEETTVLDITGSISIQAPVITSNANGEKYQVIYSFKKFTNVDSGDTRFEVGVEVRLVATFTTVKGTFNLNLSGLGAAASAGKLSGSMTLTLVGASLPKIGEAFTATSSITSESIEKALQQISTLKTMIFDADAYIDPYVIAIQDLVDTSALNWSTTQLKANNLRNSFKLNTK